MPNTSTPFLLAHLFLGIQKKLGGAGEWSVVGGFVNFTPSGTIVRVPCKTNFALGEAHETFVWRIGDCVHRVAGSLRQGSSHPRRCRQIQ